jgi:di/tricarboxylate transporter
LSEEYELRQRMNEVRVPRSSPLAHRPISQSGIGKEYGLSVMAVRRGNTTILAPAPSAVIEPDDVLLIVGRRERVEELIQCDALAAYDGNNGFDDDLISEDVSLVEVMLGPRSRAVGQTLKELRFRDKFNATVLALWHGGRSVRTDLADLPLQFGDSMLVYGSRDAIRLLQSDADFLVLRVPQKADEAPIRASKATLAIIIMAISLLIAAAGLIPIAEAVMLGSLVMVLTGCLTMDEAYRAIDWRAIFLIAGMLPVSLAMTETGAAALLGNAIVSSLSRFGPVAIGAGLLLAATALTQVMSGQVTAVVLTPIAISAAQLIGSDPRGMAMYVALGSSLAFITPTAHVVNVFVMGAGGYAASDYPRVGLPLTAILFVVIVVLVALVWKI